MPVLVVIAHVYNLSGNNQILYHVTYAAERRAFLWNVCNVKQNLVLLLMEEI